MVCLSKPPCKRTNLNNYLTKKLFSGIGRKTTKAMTCWKQNDDWQKDYCIPMGGWMRSQSFWNRSNSCLYYVTRWWCSLSKFSSEHKRSNLRQSETADGAWTRKKPSLQEMTSNVTWVCLWTLLPNVGKNLEMKRNWWNHDELRTYRLDLVRFNDLG